MPNDQFKSSSFIPKGGAHYEAPKSGDDDSSSSSGKKKQQGEGRSKGILITIAVALASIAGLAAGGVFFYTQYLESNLSSKQGQLAQAQAAFEPEIINELEAVDRHINSAKEVLVNHTAVTPVFDVVESITLASVQLTSLSISSRSRAIGLDIGGEREGAGGGTSNAGPTGDGEEPVGGDVQVSMTGIAPNYAVVALQSQSLSENEEVINPVLSQFNLTEQGSIEFSIQFSLDESYMSYDKTI